MESFTSTIIDPSGLHIRNSSSLQPFIFNPLNNRISFPTMESLQGSWQYENFSSAKEISPPISPAPPSPTLYSLNLPLLEDPVKLDKDLSEYELTEICFGTNVNSTNTSPFLLGNGPSSLLCPSQSITPPPMPILGSVGDLPSGDFQMGHNTINSVPLPSDLDDMDFRWEEQSLNLEAFEELGSLVNAQVDQLMDDVLPPKVISEESVTLAHNQVTRLEDLDASFDAILSELGLPKSTGSSEDIPIIYAQELLALQNEGEDLGLMDESSVMDEDSDSNSSIGSPSSVGQEIVVYTTDDSQSQFDSGFAVITIDNSVNSSDSEDEAQERTLDALLIGDFDTASAIYPAANIISSSNKSNSNEKSSSAITKASLALIKPERRGRKPSAAASVGKTWVNVTDKVIRKKEQNKTAATRYRQKKKLETLICLEQEKDMESQNDVLKDQKKDLEREIKLVKGLLRDVCAKRRASNSKKASNK
ncbi:unnamed protein product [Allacma fusca]|uniref:BZIP domain-containing protein n=1 Tax=Allacma fusca TaxID=39272 RepID=A0A8J2LD79_9HEXA|nr:unnamed protein product [Allacma fusca]